MDKPEIVRVWGVADEFDLTFQKGRGGGWKTTVPPDLSDGQYATEIFAEDAGGAMALWSGILYMHNGKCCLHMDMKKYTMWVLPLTEIGLIDDEIYKLKEMRISKIKPLFDNGLTNIEIRFEGVCCHD